MSAILSPDERYRYFLSRELPPQLDGNDHVTCTFIMLNPSTADDRVDDPTIRRCIGFATTLRCTRLNVVNLYAYRSTDPKTLWTVDDPIGPDNDEYLQNALTISEFVIVAWGTHAPLDRVAQLVNMCNAGELFCLGINQDGSPKHPLYVPAIAPLQLWRPNA